MTTSELSLVLFTAILPLILPLGRIPLHATMRDVNIKSWWNSKKIPIYLKPFFRLECFVVAAAKWNIKFGRMFYHKIYIIFHFCSFPSAFFILRNSRHNMLIKRFHLTKLKRHSSSSKIKLQTLTTIQIKSSFYCLCCKKSSFVRFNNVLKVNIHAERHKSFLLFPLRNMISTSSTTFMHFFSVTFELKFNAPKSLKLLKRQHFSYSINIERLFKRHTTTSHVSSLSSPS